MYIVVGYSNQNPRQSSQALDARLVMLGVDPRLLEGQAGGHRTDAIVDDSHCTSKLRPVKLPLCMQSGYSASQAVVVLVFVLSVRTALGRGSSRHRSRRCRSNRDDRESGEGHYWFDEPLNLLLGYRTVFLYCPVSPKLSGTFKDCADGCNYNYTAGTLFQHTDSCCFTGEPSTQRRHAQTFQQQVFPARGTYHCTLFSTAASNQSLCRLGTLLVPNPRRSSDFQFND